ncbi:hypothetical protein [Aquibacillus rhizosphaerae]|uniref:Uncharacterized protein n=1 Tax=Aquibacillus rhizosphaerae TaxID=3051431 RepID=A0ABT7L3V7_9BACI|nr:hypothetical protein [Aquibacillus sp. LR5S19]MDL4840558.1 hypothetical protein [Aquibacillus sp. LR5S19]
MSKKANVIDFNDYKRTRNGLDRPIFDEPVNISVGDPSKPDTYGKYMVVCNFVRNHRQFLALERKDKDDKQYVIVEGIVENGSLVKVNPVEEANYPEIENIFNKIFSKINKEPETSKKSPLKLAFKRF